MLANNTAEELLSSSAGRCAAQAIGAHNALLSGDPAESIHVLSAASSACSCASCVTGHATDVSIPNRQQLGAACCRLAEQGARNGKMIVCGRREWQNDRLWTPGIEPGTFAPQAKVITPSPRPLEAASVMLPVIWPTPPYNHLQGFEQTHSRLLFRQNVTPKQSSKQLPFRGSGSNTQASKQNVHFDARLHIFSSLTTAR